MIKVDDDLTMVSDEPINVFNVHFTVREGVTLPFCAPAVTFAQDEVRDTGSKPL